MKKNKLVRSLGTPTVGKSILKLTTLTLSMMCLSLAHANETDTAAQPTQVKKVTVTGSSIKGVAAQSASPITIIKTEDLLNQGVTSVEEALAKVSANQAGYSTAQNVGASSTPGSAANLRGLGTDKTLVLLNGRRLANSPFGVASTNLNIIPLAMVDRIEVLRDGASAIYGADAIAGVINFITKEKYEGFSISGELLQPEHKGGDEQQVSLFGGYGDLDDQGFNVFGVVDYHRTNDIFAEDRRVSRRGLNMPELGSFLSQGSALSQVANIIFGNTLTNPYLNDNCNGMPNVTPQGAICRTNTQALIGITPKSETTSALARGTLKLNDDFKAIGEYVFARNEVTASVAPDPYSNLPTLPSTSPFYPGAGITPAVPGLNGEELTLYLRSQSGNRVSKSVNDSHRAFVGIEGEAYGWDINGGITYAKSKGTDSFVSGYTNGEKVQDALNNGTLNPFGPQSDPNLWKSFDVSGKTNEADLKVFIYDFTISRSLFSLPAGDVGFAFGASYTDQKWNSKTYGDVASLVSSSGIDPDQEPVSGKRQIGAAFTEFQVPLAENLELQLAARYDDYNDFGDTFNPKVALRWEPMKELMFRTSYSTGFRAPTLSDLYETPYVTFTSGSNYSDPKLCPGGAPISQEYQTECNKQFMIEYGGNPELKAEKSKSFSAGFVLEPIKNLVFTADYFNIEVKDLISSLGEASIFNDPEKYADRFVRDSKGLLDYVNASYINAGGLKTQGFDLSLNYLTPMTSSGRWGFGIDGTYVIDLKYQEEKGQPWENLVGKYEDPAIVRWKHVANLNWAYEGWKMVFEQEFVRGYHDQNMTSRPQFNNHKVPDYTLYNFSTTYTGFKNLSLTAGIKNMFDEDPAASNVVDNFQMGYDPRYSDPTGRTYFVRGTYNF